jgi:hypothetical protein
MGLKPAINFTKTFVKDKTNIEVLVKNTGKKPRSFNGMFTITRSLSIEELEARSQARNQEVPMGPMAMPMPVGAFMPVGMMPPLGMPLPTSGAQEERFPWNIDGTREQVEVQPGETQIFQGQVQTIFRGDRLVVDEECREHFEIVDIKVGRAPSKLFKKPISAKHFFEKNMLDLGIDTATPGIFLRLIVKNLSKEPQKFGATLKGVTML